MVLAKGLDMRNQNSIRVRVELFREGPVVIARARELGVSTSGSTESAAIQSVTEALELFMETLSEMGTYEEVLVESGYVREGTEWSLPDHSEGWTLDNMVPLEVIRQVACVEI